MFIKSLRIRKTTTDEIVREVLFHKGANLIVDTEDSESHNRVGKTTFLKLIDIAMGAKDRKLIYTDADTGTVTEELRDFIVTNRSQRQHIHLPECLQRSVRHLRSGARQKA